MRNALDDARFIEDRRPDAGDQAAGLEMPLPQLTTRGVESIRCLLQPGCPSDGQDLELHEGPRQLLGQAVMDFVGNELPLVVAGAEQMFESLLFSQCRFGPLRFR